MELNLPKDAEGNAIPSNVTTMYKKNGAQVHVGDLVYGFAFKSWHVIAGREVISPSRLYLNKPDTLEQLAADLDRTLDDPLKCTCAYAGREIYDCRGCKLKENKYGCVRALLSDVAARVHRLCGDAE